MSEVEHVLKYLKKANSKTSVRAIRTMTGYSGEQTGPVLKYLVKEGYLKKRKTSTDMTKYDKTNKLLKLSRA